VKRIMNRLALLLLVGAVAACDETATEPDPGPDPATTTLEEALSLFHGLNDVLELTAIADEGGVPPDEVACPDGGSASWSYQFGVSGTTITVSATAELDQCAFTYDDEQYMVSTAAGSGIEASALVTSLSDGELSVSLTVSGDVEWSADTGGNEDVCTIDLSASGTVSADEIPTLTGTLCGHSVSIDLG